MPKNKVISLVQPKVKIIDHYRPLMVAAYMEYFYLFERATDSYAKAEICRKALIKTEFSSTPASEELKEVMSSVPYRIVRNTVL